MSDSKCLQIVSFASCERETQIILFGPRQRSPQSHTIEYDLKMHTNGHFFSPVEMKNRLLLTKTSFFLFWMKKKWEKRQINKESVINCVREMFKAVFMQWIPLTHANTSCWSCFVCGWRDSRGAMNEQLSFGSGSYCIPQLLQVLSGSGLSLCMHVCLHKSVTILFVWVGIKFSELTLDIKTGHVS